MTKKGITTKINICTGKARPVLSQKAAANFIARESAVNKRVSSKVSTIRGTQK